MPAQSTKQIVTISDIRDEVTLLKNGSLRAVIEVSAINFELRSDEEQIAIIQNFQRFLNSIDFPLQIVVNSRRLDIDDYLKVIDEAAILIQNELIKIQAAEYTKFVKELSELANIMSKKFYIVVPFYVYEAPSKIGVVQSLKSILRPSTVVTEITDEKLEIYKNQLLQRVDLVFDGLIGLGLKTRIVGKEELMNLFYGLYNPAAKNIFLKIENPENFDLR